MAAPTAILGLRGRSRPVFAGAALAAVELGLAIAIAKGHTRPVLALVAAVPAVLLLSRPRLSREVAICAGFLVPFTWTVGLHQLSVPRAAAALVLVPLLLFPDREARVRSRLGGAEWAAVGFVVASILSWWFGAHQRHGVLQGFDYVLPFAFYPAIRGLGRHHLERIHTLLLLGGAAGALTVWWEALVSRVPLVTDPTSYYWNGTSQFIFRPGGVFGSPPAAAVILAMTSLCGLPLLREATGSRRRLLLAAEAVSVGGLVVTFTRGGILGFAAGAVVYALLLGPRVTLRLVYGGAVAVVLFVVVVVPKVSGTTWFSEGVLRQGTFAVRQNYWAAATPIVGNTAGHLVFGHGVNSLLVGTPFLAGQPDPDIVRSGLNQHSPHNQYLRTLVEQGLLGLGLFLAWAIGSVVRGMRVARGSPALRRYAAGATGAAVAFLVAASVGDVLRDPSAVVMLVVVTALIAVCSRGAVSFSPGGAAPGGAVVAVRPAG